MVSLSAIPEGIVTKSIAHTAIKLISSGKLTFDESLVVHRVVASTRDEGDEDGDARDRIGLGLWFRVSGLGCGTLQGYLAHKKSPPPPGPPYDPR